MTQTEGAFTWRKAGEVLAQHRLHVSRAGMPTESTCMGICRALEAWFWRRLGRHVGLG